VEFEKKIGNSALLSMHRNMLSRELVIKPSKETIVEFSK
jgi:hypothetical protein